MQKYRLHLILLVVLFIPALYLCSRYLLFRAFSHNVATADISNSEEQVHPEIETLIDSIPLQTEVPISQTEEAIPQEYTPLIDQITGYLSYKEGLYGIHFISLTSGKRFGINDTEAFIAASTTKIPINLYLYSKFSSGEINPLEKVKYTEDDFEEGTGSIQYQNFGRKYALRELSRLSIEESDNIAINMIVRRLGYENVKNYMEQVLKHPVDFEENIFTPRDMADFMKAVLDFSKKDKKNGSQLLYYFKHTEFNDRIPLYLPRGVQVAHKIGTYDQYIHDVGIIFGKKPFILSIMSKDVDLDQVCDTIGNVARMVYDFEQGL